jgi:glutathione S-transferase
MFGGATSLSEKAKTDHATSVGYLDLFLSKSKYVAGDHFTIADIILLASASTFEVCIFFIKYLQFASFFIQIL